MDDQLKAAELRKLELEAAKLAVEISEVRKPLYRKGTFWGVAVPATVAGLTFLAQIVSGYYETQAKLIELRKEAAARDEADLDAAKLELAGEKAGLETVKAGLDKELQTFARERVEHQNAARQLDEQREGLLGEREMLRLSQEKLIADEQVYSAARNRLDEQLADMTTLEQSVLPVRTLLDTLRATYETSGGAMVQSDACEQLIRLLAVDGNAALPAVVATLDSKRDGSRISAIIDYALHMATQEDAPLDRLLAMIEAPPASIDDQVWDTLVYGNFSDEAEARVLSSVLPLVLSDLPKRTRAEILNSARICANLSKVVIKRAPWYRAVIEESCRIALHAGEEHWTQLHAASALLSLEASVGLAVMATLLVDVETTESQRNAIAETLIDLEDRTSVYGDEANTALERLGSPRLDPAAWLKRNATITQAWPLNVVGAPD